MRSPSPYARAAWGVLTVAIALVWVINGLWAKILGGVPRHAKIVFEVLRPVFDTRDAGMFHDVGTAAVALVLTPLIGVAELIMMAWFLSGRLVRENAAMQVVVVMSMNIIEQLMAPKLLLFGPWNFLWASCFCVAVILRTRLHLRMPPHERRWWRR